MAQDETAAPVVALDIKSLTLDEMAAVEDASGLSFDLVLTRAAARRRMVVFIQAYREAMSTPGSGSFDARQTWQKLGSLRVFDS